MIEMSRRNNFALGDQKHPEAVISSAKAAFNPSFLARGSYGHQSDASKMSKEFKKSNFHFGNNNTHYVSTALETF